MSEKEPRKRGKKRKLKPRREKMRSEHCVRRRMFPREQVGLNSQEKLPRMKDSKPLIKVGRERVCSMNISPK